MTMRLSSTKTIPVDQGNVLMRDVDWIAIATDVGAIFSDGEGEFTNIT